MRTSLRLSGTVIVARISTAEQFRGSNHQHNQVDCTTAKLAQQLHLAGGSSTKHELLLHTACIRAESIRRSPHLQTMEDPIAPTQIIAGASAASSKPSKGLRASDKTEQTLDEDSWMFTTRSLHSPGVLSVRSHKESLNPTASERLKELSRRRRSARMKSQEMVEEDVKVRFGSLHVREFPIICGDNPGGTSGPPLSIDWKFASETLVDMEEFEQNREPRRNASEMCIPGSIRTQMLKDAGYSRRQIQELEKPINVVRAQRRRTLETLHLQTVQLATESARRRAVNILTLGRRKREERKLLSSVTTQMEKTKLDSSRESVTVQSDSD